MFLISVVDKTAIIRDPEIEKGSSLPSIFTGSDGCEAACV